jgi:hypothetical protein
MIKQWVSSCSRNQDATSSSRQESSASVEVQDNSTPIHPISTGSLKNILANNAAVKGSQSDSTNENCSDTAHSGQNLIGKNARKKLRQRETLNENLSRSNENSETESDVLEVAKAEDSDVANGEHESNVIDHVYSIGNINYIMKGDKINHIGWATCQYSHSKTKEYRMLYKY